MAKIVFSNLHLTDVGKFLHEMKPEEVENVVGGLYIDSITNNTDTVKINSGGDNEYSGANSFHFRDNKIYTIDYSRSIYNYFFVFY